MFSSTALYYALFCSTKTYRAISSDLAVVDASGIVAYSVSGIHAAEKREEVEGRGGKVKYEIRVVSGDASHPIRLGHVRYKEDVV